MKVAVRFDDKYEVGTLTGKTKEAPNRKWGGTMTLHEIKVNNERSLWSRSAYIHLDVNGYVKFQEVADEYTRLATELSEGITLRDVEEMVKGNSK